VKTKKEGGRIGRHRLAEREEGKRRRVRQGEPLYVMRDNTLAAVIVSPEENDLLKGKT